MVPNIILKLIICLDTGLISSYITNKCEVTYSYITRKCKVTAVFNEGVARVETCCYFALMSYVTRLFTE